MVVDLLLAIAGGAVLSGVSYILETTIKNGILILIMDLLLLFVVLNVLGLSGSLASAVVLIIAKMICQSAIPWSRLFKD